MSRLSELLKKLLARKGLTQADLVRRTEELGMPVSKGTVSTYFSNPPQRPRQQVLQAFAKVFGVPVSELEEAAAYTGREPFTPDPTSDRLTQPQRNAVNEIIRLLAAGNQGAAHDTDDTAPPVSSRPSATPETTPQKMRPLPADYAADQGPSAGEEGWAQAQELGEESQDDGGDE
ncbi:helix-turn-helix domain-containing protein [Brevibacterium otitidis]|uniref:Helix-turn-helix domain-containing protein n=1 Tax=Brevibacterium otitidis TaxID=53364 RepID=A0ABV5X152_9MICO|nr:hypothetical protein GCM10023233_04340 [Brevibacterium otitidis]